VGSGTSYPVGRDRFDFSDSAPEGLATGLSGELFALADPKWVQCPGGERCKVTT
jgi:hypothetical protein